MTVTEYMRGWVLRVVIFTAIGAPAQNTATSAASAVPCGEKAAPAKPHKPSWIERKTRELACKKDKNLCDMPSSVDDATGETVKPNTLPCPAPKPAVAALRELCPPNTSRVDGQPYCVTPDGNKLVDVIRIPASASTPPR